MKHYKVGYTQGCFDMFHIGHLNLINNAKKYCDYLVVGINSDKLMETYKHKLPVINEKERKEIVENIKAVDRAYIVETLDKTVHYKRFNYEVLFIGSDWKGNSRWIYTEKTLNEYGVDVIYLPYTNGISSTLLKSEKINKVDDFHD